LGCGYDVCCGFCLSVGACGFGFVCLILVWLLVLVCRVTGCSCGICIFCLFLICGLFVWFGLGVLVVCWWDCLLCLVLWMG